MEKIKINASVDYDVLIDSGLLKEAGELIFSALLPASGVSAADPLAARRQAENTTAVIVSDDNVFPLYGEALKNSLAGSGYKTIEFVFPCRLCRSHLPARYHLYPDTYHPARRSGLFSRR